MPAELSEEKKSLSSSDGEHSGDNDATIFCSQFKQGSENAKISRGNKLIGFNVFQV